MSEEVILTKEKLKQLLILAFEEGCDWCSGSEEGRDRRTYDEALKKEIGRLVERI